MTNAKRQVSTPKGMKNEKKDTKSQFQFSRNPTDKRLHRVEDISSKDNEIAFRILMYEWLNAAETPVMQIWIGLGGWIIMIFRLCRGHHSITQQELRSLSNVRRAARVAASKTSSTPSPVRDEHSRYFLAPIWAAVSLPSLGVKKRWDLLRISSIATGSSRRSFFKPTRMMGTSGQRSLASSIHCLLLERHPSAVLSTWTNLMSHVLQGVRRVDGKADQEHMRFRIRQRA